MHKLLVVNPEKCAGCRTCEEICSLTKENEINLLKSRIHVVKREWSNIYIPIVCQQCDPPICREVCTVGAISRDDKTGAMLVNESNCTFCQLCVKACPFGSVRVNNADKKIMICNLCGGTPKCVEWCPSGALQYVPLDLLDRRKSMNELLKSIKRAKIKPKVRVVRR